MNPRTILLICLIALSAQVSNAQKISSVLGLPIGLLNPPDYERKDESIHISNSSYGSLDKNRAWIVFVSSEGAKTYTNPTAGQPFKTLSFKEYYYVTKESGEWVQICRGRIQSGCKLEDNTYENFGWIEKKHLLLWSYGLRDVKTGIHRKAFLLNQAKDIPNIIKLEKKELVEIYNTPNPTERNKIGNKTIYEFYFVLKKQGDYYLLSKDVSINPNNVEESIIGWVRQNRLDEWNTRVTLEPNFDQRAYEERMQNKDKFRVMAFDNQVSAREHATLGIIDIAKVSWDNDPILVNPSQLAETNPRRFKGGVVRFPMLKNEDNFFRTGIIGEITTKSITNVLGSIDEINYAALVDMLSNAQLLRNHVNILFVLEGTPLMAPYTGELAGLIRNIQKDIPSSIKLRIGAAVYRDIPEEVDDRLFSIQPLTSDVSKVTQFVQKTPFARWHDNTDHTALYYGLRESITRAGFNKEHTNIVILIGGNADYRIDPIRRNSHRSHKTFVPLHEITDKLCELNAHFIAMSLLNEDKLVVKGFQKQSANIIQQSANCQHELVRGVSGFMPEISISTPSIDDYPVNGVAHLKGGVVIGRVYAPASTGKYSAPIVSRELGASVSEVMRFGSELSDRLNKLLHDGSSFESVATGDFSAAMASGMLLPLLKSGREKIDIEDVKKLATEKYKLYAEAYVPKQITGAKHPLFSFVLLMPERDLKDYVSTLEKLANKLKGTPVELREALFETLVDMLKQFTGSDDLSSFDPGKTSIETLRSYMQGLEKEGLKFGRDFDQINIGDIMNKRKFKDEDVKRLSDQIIANTNILKEILREGRNHEFSYFTRGGDENLYFWIPIEYTL